MDSVEDVVRGFFSGGPFQNLVLLIGLGVGLYLLFRKKAGGPNGGGGS
jgi:hypothetical protein